MLGSIDLSSIFDSHCARVNFVFFKNSISRWQTRPSPTGGTSTHIDMGVSCKKRSCKNLLTRPDTAPVRVAFQLRVHSFRRLQTPIDHVVWTNPKKKKISTKSLICILAPESRHRPRTGPIDRQAESGGSGCSSFGAATPPTLLILSALYSGGWWFDASSDPPGPEVRPIPPHWTPRTKNDVTRCAPFSRPIQSPSGGTCCQMASSLRQRLANVHPVVQLETSDVPESGGSKFFNVARVPVTQTVASRLSLHRPVDEPMKSRWPRRAANQRVSPPVATQKRNEKVFCRWPVSTATNVSNSIRRRIPDQGLNSIFYPKGFTRRHQSQPIDQL